MPKNTTTKSVKSTYDVSKDALVATIGFVRLSENLAIEVALRSYDGSAPKVSIMKVGKRKDDGTRRQSAKLGRLTPEVAGKLAELVAKAATHVVQPPAEVTETQAA